MEELQAEFVKLRKAVEANNALLEARLKQETPKRRLAMALLSGLATVVGATVLVSVAIWAAQPLHYIEGLRPTIERLTDALEKNRR